MLSKSLSIQLFIYCTLIVSWSTGQDVKTWRSTMNFNNARNWKNGRIPCSNQRIIFPSETPVAVFMPETLQVSEMVLPLNGELIFPDNAVLKVGGNSNEYQCPNDDAEFIPITDFWYDPNNWNITSSRAFPRKVSSRNAAVPHAFQVPCRLDEAWFPADTTFRVHVIYPTTRVSKILIGNKDSYKEYNQEQFDMLIRSNTGKLLFPDFPRILISQSTCTDVTGCFCGNENHEILPTICKFLVPCPELDCSDPINVDGHCCLMCAARISFKKQSGFKMDALMQLYDKYLTTEKFRHIESFTSKVGNGRIQSIFVDNTSGKRLANDVAGIIFSEIFEKASTANSIGVKGAKLEMSKLWSSKDGRWESFTQSGISSGSVAAILISIIIACLALALYIYKKRQISGFSFARFDLRGDKIELELGTTPHEALEPEDNPRSLKSEEKSKAFDNPVYGTNVTDEASSSNEEHLGGKDYVENPMFMIFENSEKEKPS